MNGGVASVGLGMEASLVASSLQKAVLREFELRCGVNCGRLESSGAGGGGGEAPSKAKGALVKKVLSVQSLAIALFFGGVAGLCRALLSCLPPDFFDRWKRLIHDQPLQGPKPVEQESQPVTVIYDCHGVVLARIVQGGNYSSRKESDSVGKSKSIADGAPLHPSDIPSALWQAVVASEDRRFFEHLGIDPRGLTRAILSLASSGGGSTVTQQVWFLKTFMNFSSTYRFAKVSFEMVNCVVI
jgi:hypothetical protein